MVFSSGRPSIPSNEPAELSAADAPFHCYDETRLVPLRQSPSSSVPSSRRDDRHRLRMCAASTRAHMRAPFLGMRFSSARESESPRDCRPIDLGLRVCRKQRLGTAGTRLTRRRTGRPASMEIGGSNQSGYDEWSGKLRFGSTDQRKNVISIRYKKLH